MFLSRHRVPSPHLLALSLVLGSAGHLSAGTETTSATQTSTGQATPSAPTVPPTSTTPAFVLQSDNGDNRIQFGTLIHADGRFAFDDSEARVLNTWQLRRLRAIVQGKVARHFEYFLNVDFGGGNVNVRDAFMDTVFSPALRIRAGKSRVPFSYDRNQLLAQILFVERGLTTAVAPDRDTGVVVMGDLGHARVSYAAAFTNGVVDGGNSDLDTNDAKDVAGRLIVRPWATHLQSRLRGLGAAVAANAGEQGGTLPAFQTAGRQTFFAYAPGVVGTGRRTRWSPQVFYARGRVWTYAEYVRSRGRVQRNGVTGEVAHQAWQAAASWVLTGEPAPERNVRPDVNFNPPSGHIGAFQLAGRVERLWVDREAFDRQLTTAPSSQSATVWTAGVNWYPNPYIKWVLNFDRSVFDQTGASHRQPEHTLAVRAQVGF